MDCAIAGEQALLRRLFATSSACHEERQVGTPDSEQVADKVKLERTSHAPPYGLVIEVGEDDTEDEGYWRDGPNRSEIKNENVDP